MPESIQARLKELRIDLIDNLNECQDFDEDEPDTFHPNPFRNLQLHAQKCAERMYFYDKKGEASDPPGEFREFRIG